MTHVCRLLHALLTFKVSGKVVGGVLQQVKPCNCSESPSSPPPHPAISHHHSTPSGLDGPHGGPVLPHSSRQPIPGKAAIVMFESITQQYSQNPQAGPVQLICTGALSNAAMLLLLYPEVKPLIEITIMGGAMGVSGVCSSVEFSLSRPTRAAREWGWLSPAEGTSRGLQW